VPTQVKHLNRHLALQAKIRLGWKYNIILKSKFFSSKRFTKLAIAVNTAILNLYNCNLTQAAIR